jgi:hypothetical protein
VPGTMPIAAEVSAADPLTGVEPPPPSIRFTQQNPGTTTEFGVLIICAGR